MAQDVLNGLSFVLELSHKWREFGHYGFHTEAYDICDLSHWLLSNRVGLIHGDDIIAFLETRSVCVCV